MATDLQFPQAVMTPKGKAIFLGYFSNGFDCQVSRRVPATEFDREELIRRRPSLAKLSPAELIEYQRDTVIIVNEIYVEGEVEAIKNGKPTREQRPS